MTSAVVFFFVMSVILLVFQENTGRCHSTSRVRPSASQHVHSHLKGQKTGEKYCSGYLLFSLGCLRIKVWLNVTRQISFQKFLPRPALFHFYP